MVRVAMRSGSTSCKPPDDRSTARTIFMTSAVSYAPLRLRTRIVVDGSMPASSGGAPCAGAYVSCSVGV